MKIYKWQEGMSDKETSDTAYWERNMIALMFSAFLNQAKKAHNEEPNCGWYYDTENNWNGFKRVISISDGKITYHIPDDFDIGDLPQIEPNWDGHTTEEKYERMMLLCGCKIDK